MLPSSVFLSNDLYLLLVGIPESDLGGLWSLGLLIFFPLSGGLPLGALKLFSFFNFCSSLRARFSRVLLSTALCSALYDLCLPHEYPTPPPLLQIYPPTTTNLPDKALPCRKLRPAFYSTWQLNNVNCCWLSLQSIRAVEAVLWGHFTDRKIILHSSNKSRVHGVSCYLSSLWLPSASVRVIFSPLNGHRNCMRCVSVLMPWSIASSARFSSVYCTDNDCLRR